MIRGCRQASSSPLATYFTDHPGFPNMGGVLSQIPPSHYFPNFSASFFIEYHVYIWQGYTSSAPVTPVKYECEADSKRYICKINNFAYREITKRSFGIPHPRAHHVRPAKFVMIWTITLVAYWYIGMTCQVINKHAKTLFEKSRSHWT